MNKLVQLVKTHPQILILHRLPGGRFPPILQPRPNPGCYSIPDILRICMNVDRPVRIIMPRDVPVRFDDRLEFHPVVRGPQFAAALFREIGGLNNESPRPRAGVAVASTVSVYVNASHRGTVPERAFCSKLDRSSTPE
jgi:hypothetical protein